MDNLEVVNKAKLALIKGSFGKDGFPLPFVKEIFLIQCHIAGTTFRNLEDVEPNLESGKLLTFKREPNNEHDELAIVIYDETETNLGYVPREKNEILARLMDAGKLVFGKIESKEWINSWLKITVKIYLRDY